MEVAEFFLTFLIILLSAKFFAELFTYFRLPGVLGEVTAGIILGPSLIGILKVDAMLHLLAEIGILLLLFEVGLETDVGQVAKVGGRLFGCNYRGCRPGNCGVLLKQYWHNHTRTC